MSDDLAIACCRLSPGSPPSELFADDDEHLLAAALDEIGLSALSLAWDDPDVSWYRGAADRLADAITQT